MTLQVANTISPAVFAEVTECQPRWAEVIGHPRAPDVEIAVTAADLRAHDWRLCLPQDWASSQRIHLVLDEIQDFESFALLRRFEAKGSVGVRPSTQGRNIPGNRLVRTRNPLATGPAIDAAEVERSLRAHRYG